MRGGKKKEIEFYQDIKYTQLQAWGWTTNTFELKSEKEIQKVEIDYTQRLADVNRANNIYPPVTQ